MNGRSNIVTLPSSVIYSRERFYPQLVYQHMSESRPSSCTERDSAGRARKFVEGESCSGGEGMLRPPPALSLH